MYLGMVPTYGAYRKVSFDR